MLVKIGEIRKLFKNKKLFKNISMTYLCEYILRNLKMKDFIVGILKFKLKKVNSEVNC